ncbi:RING-H2 finger protein [Quillaja saponaria]|uniref:RING-H2 finger protein n=1 Tax=Quillaja saponaria TaxID=32244 RepID=A0AAD7LZ93_QUISA|nr:RING-H2 finger protein [Quillaja saponaria]
MTRPLRFLGDANTSSTLESADSATLGSDLVVILAALLCALICVLGLVAVARCAWLRRITGQRGSTTNTPSSARTAAPLSSANKGLKKKIIRSLPKLTVSAESAANFSECAICLTEFASGDEIRVLPQCGHGFHVSCVDTWLGSHSSCPSCRQVFVVARCDKCGGLPGSSSSRAQSEAILKEREDDGNRFLP